MWLNAPSWQLRQQAGIGHHLRLCIARQWLAPFHSHGQHSVLHNRRRPGQTQSISPSGLLAHGDQQYSITGKAHGGRGRRFHSLAHDLRIPFPPSFGISDPDHFRLVQTAALATGVHFFHRRCRIRTGAGRSSATLERQNRQHGQP
jgi:hypothetical protein